MPVLDSLRRSGSIRIETLGESGRWFKDSFKLTPATAVTALDDFEGEGRKAVWYDRLFKIICDQDRLRIKGRVKGWKAIIHNPSSGTDTPLTVLHGTCTVCHHHLH